MLLILLLACNVVRAALPLVDFDRMGKVGLAGSFAGFDFFQNSSLSFDSSSSTLFSRSSDGSLVALISTNTGGHISAGCALNDVFYFAGSFSSVGPTSASNVASYQPSSSQFSALGSNGPNGQVDAIYCDTRDNKVWVGGKFTSPGSSVAVWDVKAGSWSQPPFVGVTGAQSHVYSITSNSSQSSLFFAGSFVASFQGNGTALNGTNNPNVPFSAGATPFSSSLVPIPLQNAQVDGSPSTSDSQFSDINNILCPGGADGPGNSWFAADGNTAVITARKFSFITASGVRLGNTFQPNHGTTGFSVTTIPDNTVQTLRYLDPTTGENATCSDSCPLSTDSSILYQDFLFPNALSITGVQIKLSEWTGSSPGLHIMQILSSGAFASSVEDNNGESCFAPNPSNTSRTGNWAVKVANTDIPGTVQSVLVSEVDVGTSSSSGPTFTWMPYVSASGQYEMSMLIPGCTNFQDCGLRTSVSVTVFPGNDLPPSVTTIDQTNAEDAVVTIYSGPILPSSPDFVTTITMRLDDNPKGTGQDGKYELVADRIQLSLVSADTSFSDGGNSSSTAGGRGSRQAFGFFEWPLALSSGSDATKTLPNNSITFYDSAGLSLFNALGGSSNINSGSTVVSSVAHHSSGTVFLAGNLSLSSGPAANARNIIAFVNGALEALGDNGLDGPVTALLLDGDNLYIGGSFQDTASTTTNGLLKNVGMYNVQSKRWSALGAGLNGPVTDLDILDGRLQVTGNFTSIFTSSSDDSGLDAPGIAVWDTRTSIWANSGGFVVGRMSMVANGTDSTQYLAGSVSAFRKYGSSGIVMVSNGDNGPKVTALSSSLGGVARSSASASTRKRSRIPRASWMSHVKFPRVFAKRQSSTSLSPLPAPLPAPAPAVLAGAFWTNSSSSAEVAIIGGNFTFLPSSSSFGSQRSQGLAIYDQDSALRALPGSQINGTVRSLYVEDNFLYVGGEFTIPEFNANGFAIYNLQVQQWEMSGIQMLQAAAGSTVSVRSISSSSARPNTIIVAGSFAQAGSLRCQAICLLDTSSKQWNTLGNGIQGEVSTVIYAGSNQETLIAAGSIGLGDSTVANVAQMSFSNLSWAAVGPASELPGPVTALEINNGNTSSIFAAGKSSDGTSFLTHYNGVNWTPLGSSLQANTVVSQLAMVPLQDTHPGNALIEADRMLMISGSLDDSGFGNASSALFDGETFIPYVVSTTSTGTAGFVASMFHSFKSFSFDQRRFLATGIVILISIAISAGVVFLLALIGILWTLFSRRDRDDKLNKMDAQDDDDSTHHRPSSLLEHVNAATRGTIIGASPFPEKVDEKGVPDPHDHDPYGPDASNYVRAETPSDAFHGMGMEGTSRPAHARYSFDGAGEGELLLTAGAEVEILDDRDHAWWYARDVKTGREGVVPAAYLY
ncbi:cellular morphogenesis protein [Moniliophthora roreri]|nr:cellular morphogenesis protein [Moniliophthora roreri]